MTDLATLVRAELDTPVDPRITAFAAKIAAQHPDAARAVLFYGSCLWTTAGLEGQMLDFYLIVSDYRAAYGANWKAAANAMLPPNVFPFEADGLACKYAVLSEVDLARLCGPEAREPSVFARFAQPARIVWSADEGAHDRAAASVARAAETLLRLVRPTVADDAAADPLAGWRAAFVLTYGAELRAERKGRGDAIVDADPDRYRRVAIAAGWPFDARIDEATRASAGAAWRRVQHHGRRIHVMRLAKASATYAGGIDYLAWKINRHAGAGVVIRPWQRRWPLLGALVLLPKLLRRGAVK
jgi:hypothetical protein